MTDRSAVEDIKARVNIVDVVKEHVPELRKRGQNHFGLCPFHAEKTPSFSVNEQMQIFKCFGCGASGDVFTFLEKIEHLPFPEVLEKLAKRVGVEIEKYEPDPKLKKKRDTVLAINKLTNKLYGYFLTKHKVGHDAMTYLKKRGVNGELIEKFQLGWAPGGTFELRALKKKGFSDEELLAAGIAKNRNGKLAGTFWKRIIFPIFSDRGDPIGFMGRVIEKDRMPKYLNVPETVLFRKGWTLYGLDLAKKKIGEDGFAIVTEGNLNIVASHKVGRENIVAVLGTGFTTSHASTLSRYTDKIYFAFDADDAGIKATLRAIPIALSEDLEVGVIKLPDGKDVDDLVQENPKGWLSAAVSPTPAIDWVISYWKDQIDVATIDGKSSFTNSVKPCIQGTKDPIKKESWINRVAKEISVKPKTVEDSLFGTGEDLDLDEVASYAKLDKDKIERYAIGLLLQNWEKLVSKRSKLKKSYLSDSVYGRALLKMTSLAAKVDLQKEIDKLEDDLSLVCKDVMLMDLGGEDIDVEGVWKEVVNVLKVRRAEELIRKLQQKIEKAETSGEVERAQKYLERVKKLVARRG